MMKLLLIATLFSAAPAHAGGALPSPESACRALVERAGQLGETVSCEAEGALLRVSDASDAVGRALFPESSFGGYPVILPGARKASVSVLPAAVAAPAAPAHRAVDVDFDHSASRGQSELSPRFTLVQGPPGSGADKPKAKSGPPGGRNGPPGSQGKPPAKGPPGSGGGNAPPNQGGAPPSRPAPVWRSQFPPPPPTWWNTTTWDHYDWWDVLPNDWSRGWSRASGENTVFYYSRFSPWGDDFYTGWTRTTDSAELVRTKENQDQVQHRTLTSQVYANRKRCYYRAVYRYDWVQGGFYGSHWEESFERWEARCLRLPTEHGAPKSVTVAASFDMRGAKGPELPWEKDSIRVTYDGSDVRYDLSRAAFEYEIRLDDRRRTSETVTFLAGDKRRREPKADAVKLSLVHSGGKFKLRFTDEHHEYYQGTEIELSAAVYQSMFLLDKQVYKGSIRVQSAPNGEVEIPVRTESGWTSYREVYIEAWSYRRLGSASSEAWISRPAPGGNVSF